MLDDRSAKSQSKRLAKLGIDLSPERLKEVHAGAPLEPWECEVNASVAAIGAGQSPEDLEARVQRQLLGELVMVAAAVLVVVVLASGLVAAAAVVLGTE